VRPERSVRPERPVRTERAAVAVTVGVRRMLHSSIMAQPSGDGYQGHP
jgi:hypothetical protein